MTKETKTPLSIPDLIKYDGTKKKGPPPNYGVSDPLIADLLAEVVLTDESPFRPQKKEKKKDEKDKKGGDS